MNKRSNTVLIVKSIVFILLFLLLFFSFSYILRGPGEKEKNEDRKAAFAGFYNEPKDSMDVIIIGGSAVFPFYAMPYMWQNFGFTGYTMSSPVQKVENFKYLLKETEKNQHPDLYVFEVRMYTYDYTEITGEEWDFFERVIVDNLKYSTNRSELINTVFSNPDISDHLDLMRYHSNWRNLDLSELKYWDFNVHDPYKGAYFRADIEPVEIPTWAEDQTETPIPEFQEKNLRELLGYLKEKEIEALFIVSPNNIDQKTAEQYNYIQTIVEENGFRFLNMIKNFNELGLDVNADFYNRLHVNISGQRKVMDYLGKYIMENYDVDITHSQNVTKLWTEDYERWKEKSDKYMNDWKKKKEALYG